MALLKGKALAQTIAQLAHDKKAMDLVILDLRKFNAPSEFFVIGTATSEPHLKALRDHIKVELQKENLRPLHMEGDQGSEWIVVDYFDVIAHFFSERKRNFYDIEDLYADAPSEDFLKPKAAAKPRAPKKSAKKR